MARFFRKKKNGMKYASSNCGRGFASSKGARKGREVHKVLEHRVNCKEGECKCGIASLRLSATKYNTYKNESEVVLKWIKESDFETVESEARASFRGYGVRLDQVLESPIGHWVYLETKRGYEACAKQVNKNPKITSKRISDELEKHKEQVAIGALTWNKWLSTNPKAKGKPIKDGYIFYITSNTPVRVPEEEWKKYTKKAEFYWDQKKNKSKK